MEILQDLDEGIFETWDLEAIFDTANKTDRTDVNTNILEQFTDKGCGDMKWAAYRVFGTAYLVGFQSTWEDLPKGRHLLVLSQTQ